jgi:hypothetical protein
MWSTNLRPNHFPNRFFPYAQIQHTFALDSYMVSNPYLLGHIPVAHLPATWDPHAIDKARRPAHLPVPQHERDFPNDDLPPDAPPHPDD